PFSAVEPTSNIFTGFTMNGGSQLWIGGFSDCGLTDGAGHGCTSSNDMTTGLAAVSIGTNAWRSAWSAILGAGVASPVLRRGYDAPLLAVSGKSNYNVFYFPPGVPAVTSGSAALASGNDAGLAIGGSATGGAPWAGAQRDLFISHNSFLNGSMS